MRSASGTDADADAGAGAGAGADTGAGAIAAAGHVPPHPMAKAPRTPATTPDRFTTGRLDDLVCPAAGLRTVRPATHRYSASCFLVWHARGWPTRFRPPRPQERDRRRPRWSTSVKKSGQDGQLRRLGRRQRPRDDALPALRARCLRGAPRLQARRRRDLRLSPARARRPALRLLQDVPAQAGVLARAGDERVHRDAARQRHERGLPPPHGLRGGGRDGHLRADQPDPDRRHRVEMGRIPRRGGPEDGASGPRSKLLRATHQRQPRQGQR